MNRMKGKVKCGGKVRWLYLATAEFCDEILDSANVTISLSELLNRLSEDWCRDSYFEAKEKP